MPEYNNGKIYRISSIEGGLTYYGSTTVSLSTRMSKHRYSYKSYLDSIGNNVTSFQVLAFSDAEIILVESFPCNSKEELHARERHYIESNDCVNKYVPGRTGKEYYVNNKEKFAEYNSEYRAINREKIAERMAEYHADNREKIHEYKNEKFACECGGRYTKANKAQHNKIPLHRRYLENLPPPPYE